LLESMRRAYAGQAPGLEVAVVGEEPGEVDLRGDATWRALERLYSGTARSWIELRSTGETDTVCALARHISHYAGGHIPRAFVAGEELGIEKVCASAPAERWRSIERFEGEEGRLTLARITARRYLDESTIGQLGKHPEKLVRMAEIARLYQTMSLTGDEIRWRMEQLIPLRLEPLQSIYHLTGERRRFSFYEIVRAARLLDGHFPDAEVAAEALSQAVERALESGVPLVDAAYLNVTAGEWP
ncbi:MAG: hypothetical protein L0G70_07305, partial [Rubrobacter sp.]|nr:hypothetical protein [Rubrobacter sp.]